MELKAGLSKGLVMTPELWLERRMTGFQHNGIMLYFNEKMHRMPFPAYLSCCNTRINDYLP